jgi:hypothetical protein
MGGVAVSQAGAAPAATTTDFGDFDTPPDGLTPPPSGSSPTFYWGTPPNDLHMANWFVVSASTYEGDAHIDAIEPPRGDSTKACHVSGPDFAGGADLFAQLNHPLGNPADLGNYSGLTFWARLTGASSELTVALNDGSVWLPHGGDFSTLPSATFTVTSEWQQYSFTFDPKRDSAVVSIDFVVLGGGESLDLWIDEVMLECRGECG